MPKGTWAQESRDACLILPDSKHLQSFHDAQPSLILDLKGEANIKEENDVRHVRKS